MPIRMPLLVLAGCAAVLASAWALSSQPAPAAPGDSSDPRTQTNRAAEKAEGIADRTAERGRALFSRNCAHCHADDAKGDEGPNLYNLTLSDARIAKRIKEGIKGEMPRFASKFTEVDIAALTAYLRTLKD